MIDIVRVLVIDDSAYNRRTITKILSCIEGVEVIDYACDGEEGLRKVFERRPDLVTLDLEMPRLDGFSFLRIIMQNCPTPVIVVSSRSGEQDVFRALELGAVEFVAKPSARVSPDLLTIEDDLTRKVREIARTDMSKILRRAVPELRPPFAEKKQALPLRGASAEGALRQVVIGSSTGGPTALQTIFSAITRPVPIAFAIAQHMPPGFTKAFAERLNRYCALEISEARSGDLMRPGQVLVAPGGGNLLFHRRGSEVIAQVAPPQEGQRNIPSVDVLFASAAEAFGNDLLGVVLTGMGNDGSRGVACLKDRGGQVLVEAEESSVVFGMPKEAIATGKVDRVVPLPLMTGEILRRCGH